MSAFAAATQENDRAETSALMLLRAVWILALVFAVEARAGIEIDHEFSGRI